MIDIIGKRYWFFLISALVIIPGIISLAIFGLKPGVDFSSGSTMTLRFSGEVEQSQLRQELVELGYGEAVIQRTGEGDSLIRLREITPGEKEKLVEDLEAGLGCEITVRDYYSVSPVVATKIGQDALIAISAAAVFMLLYIVWAFHRMPKPFRWGMCAVAGLVHDLLVVIGIFSILGWISGVEIDALFITGMLAVVGYSVNDSIVVFDRIRENMSRGISRDFEVVVNSGVVGTLVRSLNTSLTTLFVILAVFLFGGVTIHYFILVLLLGVIAGTYSSMCFTSSLLVVWERGEWGRFVSWLPFVRKPV